MSEPYIEDGWLCEPDYAPGISQAIPGSWSKPLVNLTELDGYDEMIAAAEQRGAARELRQAALEWSRSGNDANVYAWLHYRADRITDQEDQ